MSGIIKGLVSEFTGGIAGNGKAPDLYKGGNITDTQSTDPWTPDMAAKELAQQHFSNIPDTENPNQATGGEGNKSITDTAMDMRNGGLRQEAIGSLSRGISGNGWSL